MTSNPHRLQRRIDSSANPHYEHNVFKGRDSEPLFFIIIPEQLDALLADEKHSDLPYYYFNFP
jgi:hypothetical protein